MKERRKTKRFAEKNRAVINFSIEKNSINRDPKPAWTKDLSVDGAKLRSKKPFPLDTRLIITLELPTSRQIVKLWARVIWIRNTKKKGEYELGVEFIHSLETIPNLLQHLYGYVLEPNKKRSPQKHRTFSVDVAEA